MKTRSRLEDPEEAEYRKSVSERLKIRDTLPDPNKYPHNCIRVFTSEVTTPKICSADDTCGFTRRTHIIHIFNKQLVETAHGSRYYIWNLL